MAHRGDARLGAFVTALGSPWPATAESHGGALRIGGIAAEELAERFGTPLYVYDAATLRERAQAYLDGVSGHPDAHVSFACKACCTVGVLRLLGECGLGADGGGGGGGGGEGRGELSEHPRSIDLADDLDRPVAAIQCQRDGLAQGLGHALHRLARRLAEQRVRIGETPEACELGPQAHAVASPAAREHALRDERLDHPPGGRAREIRRSCDRGHARAGGGGDRPQNRHRLVHRPVLALRRTGLDVHGGHAIARLRRHSCRPGRRWARIISHHGTDINHHLVRRRR